MSALENGAVRTARVRRVVTGVDERGRSYVVSDGRGAQRLPVADRDGLRRRAGLGHRARPGVQRGLDRPGRSGRRDPDVPGARRHRSSGWRTSHPTAPTTRRARAGCSPTSAGTRHATAPPTAATVTSGSTRPTRSTSPSSSRARSGCSSTRTSACSKAGDVIVQRGTAHSWSNRSGKPCRMAFLLLGALPVPAAEAAPRRSSSPGVDVTAEPGDVLWQPDADRIERSELTRFARWARDSGAADDADIADYTALWHWSIRDLDRFWRSRRRRTSASRWARPPDRSVAPDAMPGRQLVPRDDGELRRAARWPDDGEAVVAHRRGRHPSGDQPGGAAPAGRRRWRASCASAGSGPATGWPPSCPTGSRRSSGCSPPRRWARCGRSSPRSSGRARSSPGSSSSSPSS